MFAALLLATSSLLASAIPAAPPSFDQYRVPVDTASHLAMPRLQTRQQQRYRIVLRNAVRKGYGVVTGGTEHERPGPNFAGHYVLVQWGCGLACTRAAVIDTLDGTVLSLPAPSGNRSADFLYASGTSTADLRDLKFHTNSKLIGMPDIDANRIRYFALEGHTWRPLGVFPDRTQ